MRIAVASLVFVTSLAAAQPSAPDFQEGSTALSETEMTAAVADKVFLATPAKGAQWRLQYNANGYFFVNVGAFSDNGKWSVKGSTVCTEGKQVRYFCNEFRVKDGGLFMKRESGEVLKLELK